MKEDKGEFVEFDLITMLRNFLNFFFKNIKIELIFIIIILLASSYYYYYSKPYYETHLSAYSEILPDSKLADLLEDLSELVSKEEFDLLAIKLKVDKESVRLLRKIEIDYNKDESSFKEHFGVKIKVKVYDWKILPKLQNAIERYVNTLPFVVEKSKFKKENLNAALKSIENEIRGMEILKQNIYLSFQKNNNAKDIYLSDLNFASDKIIELQQRKVDIQNQLSSLKDLHIVKDFSDSRKSSGPNYFLNITIIFVILFVFFNSIFASYLFILKK